MTPRRAASGVPARIYSDPNHRPNKAQQALADVYVRVGTGGGLLLAGCPLGVGQGHPRWRHCLDSCPHATSTPGASTSAIEARQLPAWRLNGAGDPGLSIQFIWLNRGPPPGGGCPRIVSQDPGPAQSRPLPARCFWRPGGRSASARRGESQACLFLRPGSRESCARCGWPPSRTSQPRGRAPRGSLAARGFSGFRGRSSFRRFSFCSLSSFGGLSFRGLSRGGSLGACFSPTAFSASEASSRCGAGGPGGGAQALGFSCSSNAGGVTWWGQRTRPLRGAPAPSPTARGPLMEALTGASAGSGAELGGTHGSGTGAGASASPATASWRGGESAQAQAQTTRAIPAFPARVPSPLPPSPQKRRPLASTAKAPPSPQISLIPVAKGWQCFSTGCRSSPSHTTQRGLPGPVLGGKAHEG